MCFFVFQRLLSALYQHSSQVIEYIRPQKYITHKFSQHILGFFIASEIGKDLNGFLSDLVILKGFDDKEFECFLGFLLGYHVSY